MTSTRCRRNLRGIGTSLRYVRFFPEPVVGYGRCAFVHEEFSRTGGRVWPLRKEISPATSMESPVLM